MKVSMISLLRNLPACRPDRLADKAGICQKLLEDLPAVQAGNKIASYFKFANGEILLLVVRKICPFRDYIWVEQTISDDPTVPLGTEYMRNLSALQIILRTCLPDRQAYGTLIPAIHPFSTVMLSLKGHCFNKALNPQFLC